MGKRGDRESLLARIEELEEKVRSYEREFDIRETDMEASGDFTFPSLFDLEAIQLLQDQFARAVRVGSIITEPDGTPLTRPSNFCHLCRDIIRRNPKGQQNCFHSDAIIGQYSSGGPTIQRCMSGGLWDAGAAIVVGGKHIANWLVGQIRDNTQTEEDMRRYAREIGADEDEVAEAFRRVPSMEREQFQQIADLLFILANQISAIAYQNYQKAEVIRKNKKINKRLSKNEAYLRTVISSIPDVLWIGDPRGTILYCNPRFEDLLGLPREEIIGRKARDLRENRGILSLRGGEGFTPEREGIYRKEEELHFQKDGHRETAEILFVPIRGEKGRSMGTLGMGRDVTAYRKLEKEQQDNIRFFQNLDRMNRMLQNSLNGREMLEGAEEVLLQTFPCGRVFFIHRAPHRSDYWYVGLERRREGFSRPSLENRDYPLDGRSAALMDRVRKQGGPVAFSPKDLGDLSWGSLAPARDLLIIYLASREEESLFLCLEQGDERGPWTTGEIKRFQEMAHPITRALSNLALHREIEENEAFLSDIFETIPLMIFIKDAVDLKFLRLNRAGEQLLGLRREDLIGKSDFDFFPAPVAEQFIGVDRTVLSSGKMADVAQETLRNSRGEEVILHTKKVPILDKEGRPRYLFGISEDITEKILTENELRKTRVWLDSFIDAIDYGFIIFDRNARIVLINRKVLTYQPPEWSRERLIGMSLEDFLGLTPPLRSPGYGEGFFSRYQEVLETGRSVESDISQTRDGETLWFHTRLFPVLDGFALVSRDITEQKSGEIRLRETSERMESFLNSASNLIGLFDGDLKLVMANETARRYLFSADREREIRGIGLEEIAERLGDQGTLEEKILQVREKGEPVYFENRTLMDNKIIWLSYRLFPASGGIGFIISDVSDMKKLEEQLLQVQKIESIGRLAGGIAHDFNNMLSIIMGFTEMAQAEAGEGVREYLEEVMKASRRSAQLTQQLLTFARKQSIQPRIVNLNETVPLILKILKSLIGEHIELVWQPGDRLPPIEIDPTQVDQIIANLCINARDAIEGTGRITLATEGMILDRLYSMVHPESRPGRYVILTVSDNGIGMDRETRDRIFEPFFTTKDVGKGTGLGLSTVYGIVRQNRGFITVYSEPGLGTTMKLFFPAAPGDGEDPFLAEEPETMVRGGNESILIVEDEKIILTMAASILRSFGYRVRTANTPEAALRLAEDRSFNPDLIITDVIMPGMNGGELRERAALIHPDALFLYMSGYASDIIEKQGVSGAETPYLQKPFTRLSLASRVREVLDGHKK